MAIGKSVVARVLIHKHELSTPFPAPIDNFEDAMSEMSEQFVIGTMRGSFIHKLSTLSESIMRQILNLQLRVPPIHEKNVIETTMEADATDDKVIDFSRPSDYRMKAIEAKSLGVGAGGDDASHLSGTSRMSTVGTATSSESVKIANTPYEGKLKWKTLTSTCLSFLEIYPETN